MYPKTIHQIVCRVESESHVDLSKAIEIGNGPMVVFPEKTTSNGKGLLEFADVFDHPDFELGRRKLHLVVIKYAKERFSAAWTVGSPIIHFVRLVSQINNRVEVLFLTVDDNMLEELACTMADQHVRKSRTDLLKNIMSSFGKIKSMYGMSWRNKKDFVAAYTK